MLFVVVVVALAAAAVDGGDDVAVVVADGGVVVAAAAVVVQRHHRAARVGHISRSGRLFHSVVVVFVLSFRRRPSIWIPRPWSRPARG